MRQRALVCNRREPGAHVGECIRAEGSANRQVDVCVDEPRHDCHVAEVDESRGVARVESGGGNHAGDSRSAHQQYARSIVLACADVEDSGGANRDVSALARKGGVPAGARVIAPASRMAMMSDRMTSRLRGGFRLRKRIPANEPGAPVWIPIRKVIDIGGQPAAQLRRLTH